jgi:hypothetical protein
LLAPWSAAEEDVEAVGADAEDGGDAKGVAVGNEGQEKAL